MLFMVSNKYLLEVNTLEMQWPVALWTERQCVYQILLLQCQSGQNFTDANTHKSPIH